MSGSGLRSYILIGHVEVGKAYENESRKKTSKTLPEYKIIEKISYGGIISTAETVAKTAKLQGAADSGEAGELIYSKIRREARHRLR